MSTVDLTRLTVAGSDHVGASADMLAFDSSSGWLYVASRTGVVAVLAEGATGLTKPGSLLRPGALRPAGTAVGAAAGAEVFLRASVDDPTALAFTVAATPSESVDLFWSVSCDGTENDVYLNEQHQTTAQTPVSGYPPVLAGAFVCFVTVRARPAAGGRVRVAIFGY